jgi:hypothetical protein
MLDQCSSARRSAVSLDGFLAGEKHRMHCARRSSLTSSISDRDRWIAVSASCIDRSRRNASPRGLPNRSVWGRRCALGLSRCRIVDRENPPPSSVLHTSTAKAGAGRGMVCCAFSPIGYMKPDQPGAPSTSSLAKVRAAQQRWR